MVDFDFTFHKYEIFILYEDINEYHIIATSNNKNIAENIYDKYLKEYTASPIITKHFKLVLLDIDRDAEIKSYDSRTDIC